MRIATCNPLKKSSSLFKMVDPPARASLFWDILCAKSTSQAYKKEYKYGDKNENNIKLNIKPLI